MKRFVLAMTNVAVLCLGVGLSGAAMAQAAQNQPTPQAAQNQPAPEAAQNQPNPQVTQNLPNTAKEVIPLNLTSAQPTRGVVFFTATINSNGTVAACFGCNPANTMKLGTGQYQIDFGQNVQAVNGWSRWVQADPLNGTTENAWCNTADRLFNSNAVWVNCQTSGGPGSQGNSKPIDASFFLFVAR